MGILIIRLVADAPTHTAIEAENLKSKISSLTPLGQT